MDCGWTVKKYAEGGTARPEAEKTKEEIYEFMDVGMLWWLLRRTADSRRQILFACSLNLKYIWTYNYGHKWNSRWDVLDSREYKCTCCWLPANPSMFLQSGNSHDSHVNYNKRRGSVHLFWGFNRLTEMCAVKSKVVTIDKFCFYLEQTMKLSFHLSEKEMLRREGRESLTWVCAASSLFVVSCTSFCFSSDGCQNPPFRSEVATWSSRL